MTRPQNLLILMSDEHNPKIMGCAGNPIIQTPHLDALARGGTRFSAAYTTCPICVPARAAFATGKYVHQVGYWDNADGYEGAIPSWHHRLRDQGHEVVSIGKLHFRGAAGDDHGFSQEIVPMHIIDAMGDVKGLLRSDIPKRHGGDKMAKLAGPGESTYTVYDRDIAARAQIWLHEAARRSHDKPWVLFVSFVAPHFPLTAPPDWYYRYFNQPLPRPKQYDLAERPDHPYLRDYAHCVDYDPHFKTEQDVQRALAGYYGLVSSMDENVGKVLAALHDTGLDTNTRIVYTSDHGDNLGARGLWGKSTFYEEASGVPMIVAGDDIPAAHTETGPVSHVDIYPWIFECVGAPLPDDGHPGRSLGALARGEAPAKPVVAEYHAMSSTGAAFMLRDGRWKYLHYVNYRPQLYDLESDPEELHDLGEDPAFAQVRQDCLRKLRAFCDPQEVDARAKARQAELLARAGGREAAIARGDLGFSPAPGTKAELD
jgi:choline-sulfatase